MYLPEAEQVIHQTWAYEQGSERLNLKLGYQDQRDMFNDLKLSYEKAAKSLGDLKIIPSGQAFQNALYLGFTQLHRDTYHASIPEGRYLLAAVWYEFFTGNNVVGNKYCPENLSKKDLEFLQNCAHCYKKQMQ